ncbi:MAG TPA: ABC transporter permease [Flavitalea sp.]|nr:ABC transporter permease [Flavitalea sp.]
MISNYLKIALRNLIKRRGYSLLNIGGLTIGMTCCMLIFHHVSYEKSYDGFSPVAKDVVRLRLDSYQKGKLAWQSATIYPAIAPTIRKDFPEVLDFCRLHDAEMLLTNEANDVKFNETKGYFADPSFVKMFDVNLIKGNPATALDAPDKMVISESMSKKYFGNGEALGKNLTVRDPGSLQTYQVTGVFKDYPKNSHLIVDYLVSYSTLGKILRLDGDTSNATETSWGWYDFYSYLQLKPGTDYEKLESKLPAFCDRYINSQEWYKTNNNRATLHLLPVTDIHLYSNYNQEAEVNGNGQAVEFLFLVAIFIIGIAWINYINLATARSAERAREVGVRKVLGAVRSMLIRQFLVESFLLNTIALLLSVLAFYLLWPAFDTFVGRDFTTDFALTHNYWLLFLALFSGGTMLSGLYPSLVLSSFQPITVLKGVFKNTAGGMSLRKGLIVVQFITSVVLIAGTIIVYQQVDYMRRQQLGVNINQTLVLQGAGSLQDSLYQNVFQPFKNELLQQGNIKNVSASTSVMGNEIYWTSGVTRLDKPNETAVTLYHLGIDHDFLPAYDLKLVAGRNFSQKLKTDEKAAIINERAAELLGYKSAAEVVSQNSRLRRGRDTLSIVGVVSDYHHQGLQKAIDPMILLFRPNTRSYYSVKIGTTDIQKTIGSVQKVWSKYFPSDPLNYFFLDETFNQQYKSDTLFGKVFAVFAFLAILIACFGLLGLSAYNVLQRAKEIGIRKVLGASVQNILLLLSKDFLKLIVAALILAIPVGWFVMHEWLQDFAYRINIAWWVFAVAGIISLGIALLVISVQAIKAAVENPVKSLRTE